MPSSSLLSSSTGTWTMRTISFCLLSTLELSWCLASPPTPLALENTRNFPPLFFPSTHSDSLLAVFGSSDSAGSILRKEPLRSSNQRAMHQTIA
ncbi:hypothetical protein BJV77DRAFT_434553 [Russula vinacea]|nr:hypothetical protein BJV77DRAFT_434553 [Russula vinacea]